MKVRTKKLVATALLALAAVPLCSLAQEPGWYAGVGLGMSNFKGACDGLSGPGISCDDKDTAFKLFGGYQVNPNFAVEFGYSDLGKTKADFAGFGSVSIAASGYEALAVAIAPINPQWSVFGKLGFFRWDADLNDGTGLLGSASASGTDLTYGFGANYGFSKNGALRIEYQKYSDVGDENTTGSGDVDVIGVSAIYRF
jgi:OmpA-OmpF porin, OOP family